MPTKESMNDSFESDDHLRHLDAECKLLAVISHAQNSNSAHGKVNISTNRIQRASTLPAT
jgi:hypothetical protein